MSGIFISTVLQYFEVRVTIIYICSESGKFRGSNKFILNIFQEYKQGNSEVHVQAQDRLLGRSGQHLHVPDVRNRGQTQLQAHRLARSVQTRTSGTIVLKKYQKILKIFIKKQVI